MEHVFETAVKFIEQHKKDDPRVWNHLKIAGSSNEIQNKFWWNDTICLYDIPLENKKTRERSGYLLVSESRELPPVLEYATTGLSLKESIDQLLVPALAISKIKATPNTYYFVSSTELYVSLEDVSSKEEVLINIPDLYVLTNDIRAVSQRVPADIFDPITIERYWEELSEVRTQSSSSKVLPAVPVRYQQNCSAYTLGEVCTIDRSSGNPLCHPNRISGCVPVAWAMLLSAYKRAEISGEDKIWHGHSCWELEWSGNVGTSNPSKCAEVEKTIWKLHKLMGTSAAGGTKRTDTIKGKEILKEFGLTWDIEYAEKKDFKFLQQIIDSDEPFLFSDTRDWSRDKAGHCVVAYGYEREGSMLKVSLGWGKSTDDRWINFDQLSGSAVTYRKK
ncbi:MAG: hypothetical protein AAF617_11420 [Bacteroidota bacterium]